MLWYQREMELDITVLNFDLEKASDRVSHQFLCKTLKMGIPTDLH